jgi:UDP-N-acetylmuramate: L-alanyl-gamma-D-glutamyl-meso-diaminopimelate ligase
VRPLVVTGAHAAAVGAMCIAILEAAGLEPGYSLAGKERAVGTRRKLVGGSAKPPPYVTTTESADATVLIVTSGAADAKDALLVVDARLGEPQTHARLSLYGLDGDQTTPTWLGYLLPFDSVSGAQPFDLFIGGSSCGRFALKVAGEQNVRNAIGAIAACAEGFGVDVEKARAALTTFEGLPR